MNSGCGILCGQIQLMCKPSNTEENNASVQLVHPLLKRVFYRNHSVGFLHKCPLQNPCCIKSYTMLFFIFLSQNTRMNARFVYSQSSNQPLQKIHQSHTISTITVHEHISSMLQQLVTQILGFGQFLIDISFSVQNGVGYEK